MPHADATSKEPSPHQPIRRFDVFAEYTRQERRKKGFPEDEAKGYGIWLTKVVASRRFGQTSSSDDKKPSKEEAHEAELTFRPVGTSCRRTRPSITTSSSGWARGSTTRSSCRRSLRPGKRAKTTRP